MTECENPYRHFPQKSLPPEPVWKEGFEKGQQNPDPKQYAKREELEKAIATDIETIKEFKHDHEHKDVSKEMREFIICAVCSAADSILLRIRTHGLEE